MSWILAETVDSRRKVSLCRMERIRNNTERMLTIVGRIIDRKAQALCWVERRYWADRGSCLISTFHLCSWVSQI